MENRPFDTTHMMWRFSFPTTIIKRHRNEAFFSQGDQADVVFYLENGHVKRTVVSGEGREAVVGILGPGAFFGESCLAGQPVRHLSVTAVTDCVARKIPKAEMSWALKNEAAFSEFFLSYVLTRKIRLEEDLADQLCNPCELRLARTLLSLTEFGESAHSAPVIPRIDQLTLAAMVGTTQPRISFLLHRFKERGLIECVDGLRVNRSLLKIVPACVCERSENCGPDYSILNNL
jgi:CRP/FNR family transcriptional regulator, cyclic AMP receptor protein